MLPDRLDGRYCLKYFCFWRSWLVFVFISASGSIVLAQMRAGPAVQNAADQSPANRTVSPQPAAAALQQSVIQQRLAARRFLSERGLLAPTLPSMVPGAQERIVRAREARAFALKMRGLRPNAVPSNYNLSGAWTQIGPAQTMTPAYGAVTGRVTSIAVDSSDSTGNSVYIGTTGGGVWQSNNAASVAADVTFTPITDSVPSVQSTGIGSTSIGAITVQPGGGVVLAGTGDPNDALDSYYGEGILRRANADSAWATIVQSVDAAPHSFAGEGFAGFAWGSSDTVVAAVVQALDGLVVNALQANSVEGLYYSLDAGATWQLSTISDVADPVAGSPGIVQSGTSSFSGYDGNAATAVVWNSVRKMFYAAIRYHGYYQSPDGVVFTRMASQPGTGMSLANCPTQPFRPGNVSCPMFRGALAAQASTGDLFAISVDLNDNYQGVWRDVCGANCGNGSAPVNFAPMAVPSDSALTPGTIEEGDYDLWIAALPAAADTLLYVGTTDVFKCSVANGCDWKNLSNVGFCDPAVIAPFQHAVGVGSVIGPLMFFGNDSGLWRSTDGVNEQPSACTADFQNLNGALGSLAEVTALAQSSDSSRTILVAEGVNGTAASAGRQSAWQQVMDGYGANVAIDPVTSASWYASVGAGVSVDFCGGGGSCSPAAFEPVFDVNNLAQPATDGEGLDPGIPAVWILDPQNSQQMIVGTCRVWRGSVTGGNQSWTAADALSTMLDNDNVENDSNVAACNGNAQIRSLGASGTLSSVLYGPGTTQEILYAGMEGTLDGGGTVAGHVFTQSVNADTVAASKWTDIGASPITNSGLVPDWFNPGGFAVSSVVADTHDPSGQTVYATIQGESGTGFTGRDISEPTVYQSTNQGASWTNITANLPDVPVNGLAIDPGNANIVYVATDAGVYVTTNVTTCATGRQVCWSAMGTAMPDVPVTTIATWGSGNNGLVRAGTYGRGVWQIALVSGTVPLSSMSFSPGQLTFADQPEGTASAARVVIVTNTGTAPLLISTTSATGNFTVYGDTCSGTTVPANGTCSAGVSFNPQALGMLAGSLILSANVPNGSNSAALTGTGVSGVVAGPFSITPPILNFGPVVVGATANSSPFQITVANAGNSTMILGGGRISGSSEYRIAMDGCSASLAANSACAVVITFTPKASGAESGLFSITGGGVTLGTELQGNGQAPPTDTLNTKSLQFGAQVMGTTSATQTVVIRNTGDQALTSIGATSNLADFGVNASGCLTGIPGHQSCAVLVTFSPADVGLRTGILTIADELHTQVVTLLGTGLAPAWVASVGPLALNFGSQGLAVPSAAQSVTLTNNGNTILSNLGFDVTPEFSVSPGSCGKSLAIGASCSPAVTFTPAVTGPQTGTLRVTGSNVGQSLETALAGVGLAFNMTLTSPSSVTVISGTNATYSMSIAPTGLSTGTIALACSGAPANSTCKVSPAIVTLTAGTTAFATMTVVTPAVTTARLDGAGKRQGVSGLKRAGLMFGGIAMACAFPIWGGRRRTILAGMAGMLLVLMVGCGLTTTGGGKSTGGGSSGTGGTGANSTLTVTASAPGVQQALTMTLVLEQ